MTRVTKADLESRIEFLEARRDDLEEKLDRARRGAAEAKKKIDVLTSDLHDERERRHFAEKKVGELRGRVWAYREVLLNHGLISEPSSEEQEHERRDAERYSHHKYSMMMGRNQR